MPPTTRSSQSSPVSPTASPSVSSFNSMSSSVNSLSMEAEPLPSSAVKGTEDGAVTGGVDAADAPLNVVIESEALRDRAEAEDDVLPKHPRFWFDDGNMVFLVENVLYKVHRYFFLRDSTWFTIRITQSLSSEKKLNATEWFPLPFGWEQYTGPDGKPLYVNTEAKQTSVEHPSHHRYPDCGLSGELVIPLDGVTSKEFDAFLSVLYPLDFDTGDLSSQTDWAAVLKLATRWQFSTIRSRAIRILDPTIRSFTRLMLARHYKIDEWVQPALVDLCIRQSSLSLDEIKQMDHEDVALVMHVRETVRMRAPPGLVTRENMDILVRKWNAKDGMETVIQEVTGMMSKLPAPSSATVAKPRISPSTNGKPPSTAVPTPVTSSASQPTHGTTSTSRSTAPQATQAAKLLSPLTTVKPAAFGSQTSVVNPSTSTVSSQRSSFGSSPEAAKATSSGSPFTISSPPVNRLTTAQTSLARNANAFGSPFSSTEPSSSTVATTSNPPFGSLLPEYKPPAPLSTFAATAAQPSSSVFGQSIQTSQDQVPSTSWFMNAVPSTSSSATPTNPHPKAISEKKSNDAQPSTFGQATDTQAIWSRAKNL